MPITATRPNTSTLGRSTPSCAPIDIATGVANGPSRRVAVRSGGPRIVTPAVAPTDSQKPTERTSSGSTTSRTTTAHGEQPWRLPFAADGEGERRQGGHRAGTQHRRLGAGEHDEPPDHRERGDQPHASGGRAASSGPGDRQGERDVLAGDGRQVRQPAVAEAGGHRLGLRRSRHR